jgi:hypothetical protein
VSGSARVVIIGLSGTVLLVAFGAIVFLNRPAAIPLATPAVTPISARPTSVVSTPAAPSPPPPRVRATPSRLDAAAVTPSPQPVVAAPPTTGTLHIESDVPDTSVFIDRVFLGTAPVTAENLAPGTHHLNMSATGFDGVSEDITVEAGSHDLSIKFKEIKLDAKALVVHKHAFGSCAGTLHATPQGLRYDTANADDAFNVPLTDLETFEVDYLNKNLRVKVRRGKTYNFTDPDGNADRLFVFQRDVEKVRQRLMAK